MRRPDCWRKRGGVVVFEVLLLLPKLENCRPLVLLTQVLGCLERTQHEGRRLMVLLRVRHACGPPPCRRHYVGCCCCWWHSRANPSRR